MSEILSKLFEKTLKSCEVPDSLSQDTCFSERYVFVTLIDELLHSSTPKTKVFWNLWQESSANAAIVWGDSIPLFFIICIAIVNVKAVRQKISKNYVENSRRLPYYYK
jgi:hypothetical protein